jgi:Uma2 family endonuclease
MSIYADLLELPAGVRPEILAGQIVTVPAPLPKHSKAQRPLGSFIGRPFDDDHEHGGPGGWWIFVEVDVQLAPHDVVRPDLSGWRRERLPDPADQRPIVAAPDWVCEVLSRSTAAYDRVTKRNLYAKHDVRLHWIVDVDARTLEAFELVDHRWVLPGSYDDTASAAIAPFTDVELTIGRLFLPAAPPPPA